MGGVPGFEEELIAGMNLSLRRIKAAAEANSRSMNAEIVARLGASFEEGDEKFIAKVAAATLKALVENYPESTWDEMRSSISAATVGDRD